MADWRTLDTPEGRARFLELHRRCRPAMLYAAMNILNDHHLAEDAVQEAFLRVAKNFHKVGAADHPATRVFVVTVARNVALTMAVRLRRQIPAGLWEEGPWMDDTMEESVFRRMEYEDALEVIRALAPIYREPLLLYYVEECTTTEIARRLGLGVETVKKRLQRGRRMVAEGLSGYEDGGRGQI